MLESTSFLQDFQYTFCIFVSHLVDSHPLLGIVARRFYDRCNEEGMGIAR